LNHLYRALEFRVLRNAGGLVVTTEEAAEIIRARYRKPVATVMNGYDVDEVKERARRPTSEGLRIVHTGTLMHELRDPTPLFRAMKGLRAQGHRVVVDFFGRDSAVALKAAKRIGVGDSVSVQGPVSHEEALELQRDADVLLLLQWSGDRIACPQKIFEYVAARRPILSVGPDDGPVARLLHEFGMGVVARNPDDIARELLRLLQLKRETGRVPDVSPKPPRELSCSWQVERIVPLLNHVATS
jgi:glycosyltransferase involved in cell wall biosynthesis